MADRTCSIDDCAAKVVARGWCNRHYLRWQSHGDPLVGRELKRPVDHTNGTRTCTGCRVRQPIDNFGIERSARGGHRSQCKACRVAVTSDWYYANQQRQQRRARDRNVRDAEAIRARDKARYERDRDKRIALATEAVHRRRVRLTQGVYESGISIKSLRALHGDACPYCGISMLFVFARNGEYIREKATIEHVVPLSLGGDHTFANTVLCCWQCNVRKNAKLLEEWIADGREALRQNGTAALDEAS